MPKFTAELFLWLKPQWKRDSKVFEDAGMHKIWKVSEKKYKKKKKKKGREKEKMKSIQAWVWVIFYPLRAYKSVASAP